jgi:hypothetical protein
VDPPKRLDQVVTDLCHCSEHEGESIKLRMKNEGYVLGWTSWGKVDGWEIRGSCALIERHRNNTVDDNIFLDKN